MGKTECILTVRLPDCLTCTTVARGSDVLGTVGFRLGLGGFYGYLIVGSVLAGIKYRIFIGGIFAWHHKLKVRHFAARYGIAAGMKGIVIVFYINPVSVFPIESS